MYSSIVQDHVLHLESVLAVLEKHQLFANMKKCSFGHERVEYLGHIISAEGVATDPHNILAVENLPMPRNVKELTCFLR